MKTPQGKLRVLLAVTFFSTALVIAVLAADDDEGITTPQICRQQLHDCIVDAHKVKDDDLRSIAFDLCRSQYNGCMDSCETPLRKGQPPGQIAPPNKSHPTPTPRPGPSATAPPNKSNPTPTPRKGPGKIGTTGIGKASPTPSPKGPVLLEKSGKPSPSPRPTPKQTHKSDHH